MVKSLAKRSRYPYSNDWGVPPPRMELVIVFRVYATFRGRRKINLVLKVHWTWRFKRGGAREGVQEIAERTKIIVFYLAKSFTERLAGPRIFTFFNDFRACRPWFSTRPSSLLPKHTAQPGQTQHPRWLTWSDHDMMEKRIEQHNL